MKKLLNKKGFTLMEMMIVIAIIVILVAIAVPSFNSSLDKANSATDDANERAAKSVAMTYLTDANFDDSKTYYYDMTDGDLYTVGSTDIDGVPEAADCSSSNTNDGKYIQVTFTAGKPVLTWVDLPADSE